MREENNDSEKDGGRKDSDKENLICIKTVADMQKTARILQSVRKNDSDCEQSRQGLIGWNPGCLAKKIVTALSKSTEHRAYAQILYRSLKHYEAIRPPPRAIARRCLRPNTDPSQEDGPLIRLDRHRASRVL